MKIITKIKSFVKDHGCVIFASLLVYGLFQLGLYFKDTTHQTIFVLLSSGICGFIGASAWMSWEELIFGNKRLKEFVAKFEAYQSFENVKNLQKEVVDDLCILLKEQCCVKEEEEEVLVDADFDEVEDREEEVLVDADFDEVEDREDYLSAKKY